MTREDKLSKMLRAMSMQPGPERDKIIDEIIKHVRLEQLRIRNKVKAVISYDDAAELLYHIVGTLLILDPEHKIIINLITKMSSTAPELTGKLKMVLEVMGKESFDILRGIEETALPLNDVLRKAKKDQ